MHHSYLDKYARHDSPLHRIDPRIKMILSLAYVVLIALTPEPGIPFLVFGAVLVFSQSLLAGVPPGYLLSRSAVVIPFAGFAILSYALTMTQGEVYLQWGPFALTSAGLARGIRLLFRAWICVCLIILLINTTPFDRLLNSLRALRVPVLFVMLLSFLYRYLYLFWDEVERMQRARNLRYFGGHWRRQPALLGHMLASLFVRSYDRAGRVHMAMTSRGWSGETKPPAAVPLNLRDWLFIISGGVVFVLLWLLRTL